MHTRYRRRRIHRLASGRALLERGDDVVVLDSARAAGARGRRRRRLPDGVEFIVGDVGDHASSPTGARGRRRASSTSRPRSASASRCTRSSATCSVNTLATARFLERVVAASRRPARLVVASSMSIYGEGEYECAEHGAVAPAPAAGGAAARARSGNAAARSCGASSKPIGDTPRRSRCIPTSIYADHQARPRGALPRRRRRLRHPHGRPALLQRLRPGPGALESVHRELRRSSPRGCSTATPPLIFEDGAPVARLHPRLATSSRRSCSRSNRGRGRHAINLGTGRADSVGEVADAARRGARRRHRAGAAGQYRAGDIRHCFADTSRARELLGFEAKVASRTAWRELARVAAGARRRRPGRRRHAELAARGLAR